MWSELAAMLPLLDEALDIVQVSAFVQDDNVTKRLFVFTASDSV
jgi:hypothetical protein